MQGPLWPPDLKRLRNWSISGLERGSELEAGSPGERTYVESLLLVGLQGPGLSIVRGTGPLFTASEMRTVKHFREVLD